MAPERDEARFFAAWDVFAALRLHLDQEERVLLPVFDRFADRAAPNQRPNERLAVLVQVLDHHDRREAAGMLAILDGAVPAELRTEWIAAFRAEELPPVTVELRTAPPAWPSESDDPDHLAAAAAQDGELPDMPTLGGVNGARVGRGLVAAVETVVRAGDLEARRDGLIAVLDALRRWRAVRSTPAR